MHDKHGNRIIFVNDDVKPSPHKLDLNRVREQEPAYEKKEPGKVRSAVYDYLDELGLVGLYEKGSRLIGGFARKERKFPGVELSRRLTRHRKLKRLAVLSLVSSLFLFVWKMGRYFHKLCYGTGWMTVFCVRFVVILVSRLAGFSGRVVKAVYSAIPSSGSDLGGPQATGRSGVSGGKQDGAGFVPTLRSGQNETRLNSSRVIPMTEKKEGSRSNARRSLTSFYRFLGSRKLLPGRAKPAIMMAALFFAVILPFKAFTEYYDLSRLKGEVLGVSEKAVGDMVSASEGLAGMDLARAEKKFSQAGNNFAQARSDISRVSGLLQGLKKVIPQEKIKMAANADAVLAAGELSARAAREMTQALALLGREEQPSVKEIVNGFHKHISRANENVSRMRAQIQRIDPEGLPPGYRGAFREMTSKGEAITGSLQKLERLLGDAKTFLGFEYDKRYLLVFQNNTEMRASGGFIGSYALVDIANGRIENLEVPGGGSYDTEAGLYERIKAPKPLRLLRPLWHFWDANWWPDWAKSARKLAWFFEKSDGPTVDGVIGVTPTAAERFMQVLGPIDLEEKYGITFTADNFWRKTQALAERKPDETKEPKDIIGDLMQGMLGKLKKDLDKQKLFELAQAAESSLAEKHILFYFYDRELQSTMEDLGWAGRMKDTEWDYLQVVNSNIGGHKSDKDIKQKIYLDTEIRPDGSVVNTARVIRTHTGQKDDEFSGYRNVNWLRLYVPRGSKLLGARGFEQPPEKLFEEAPQTAKLDRDVAETEGLADVHKPSQTKIYKESGKTVFANWVQVDPGDTVTATFEYKLPFKIKKPASKQGFWQEVKRFMNPGVQHPIPYALLVQKQPGSKPCELISRLHIADRFRKIWQHPPKTRHNEPDGWQIETELDSDKYWAGLFVDSNN